MTRSWLRWLPGITVSTLLALALIAPTGGLGARSLPQPDYLQYPQCTVTSQGGLLSASPYSVPVGEGISVPFGEVGNVTSCSLGVAPTLYSFSGYKLVSWDPNTLAPVAGAIALRSRGFSVTNLLTSGIPRWDFIPPLVTRSLANVAEPPPSQVALELRTLDQVGQAEGPNPQVVQLAPDDATSAPSAWRILSDGSRIAIPGTHPVAARMVCGGDAQAQAFQVMQSVITTDATLDPASYEFIQRFRVPVATRVGWVELAFGEFVPANFGFGTISVLDADGQPLPPLTFPSPLASAEFYVSVYPGSPYGARWETTFQEFATTPTLQPNHDYWLVAKTDSRFALYAKSLTGTESPYFKTAIGLLFRRAASGTDVELVLHRALDFKLVGTPAGTVGVTPPAPSRAGFALSASPNPARGAASIAWSGAKGGVRFEVLDARGRRVAAGANAPGSEGRWSFTGAGDDGRALPAGIYFVRARDERGRTASVRVSLVR